jgi:hypothetical protein
LKITTSAIIAAVAAAVASGTAMATQIELTYTGIVSYAGGSTANSGYTDGSTISGQLLFDTATDVVTGATLGVFAAPNGLVAGSANLNSTDAIFQQGQYATNGDPRNNSITVDLSAAGTGYSVTSLGTLLTQNNAMLYSEIDFTAGTLGQYLNAQYSAGDGFGSTATFLEANADGTNQTEVVAYLESVTAGAPVPLPASGWLLVAGAGGLLGFSRRRKAKFTFYLSASTTRARTTIC